MGAFLQCLYKNDFEEIQQFDNKNLFDFVVNDIDGKQFPLSNLQGKKAIIIVNVACKCGFASQNYKQLCQLYAKYKKQGLEILAFPSNSFMQQEPWDPPTIKQFVIEKFKIDFPLLEKVEVNGPASHDLYKYLRYNSSLYNKQLKKAKMIPWNYSKFLINSKGEVINFYSPSNLPLEMEKEIQKLLN